MLLIQLEMQPLKMPKIIYDFLYLKCNKIDLGLGLGLGWRRFMCFRMRLCIWSEGRRGGRRKMEGEGREEGFLVFIYYCQIYWIMKVIRTIFVAIDQHLFHKYMCKYLIKSQIYKTNQQAPTLSLGIIFKSPPNFRKT